MIQTATKHNEPRQRSFAPISGVRALDFELPPQLEAGEPPEARGLARDEVRLMISYRASDRIVHARFRDLPDYLSAGDVVAINTSGTLSAALEATRADGTPLELHLSTHLPADLWIVELRRPGERDGHIRCQRRLSKLANVGQAGSQAGGAHRDF